MSTLRAGKLQTPHTDTLNASSPLVVPDLATLRTLSATLHDTVQTLGYHAPGDGGQGLYRYDADDSTSPDNGGTLVVGLAEARWALVHQGSTHLRQWGVVGDRVTDDTAAVRAALEWAGPLARTLVVPSCTGIRLTSTLEIGGSPRLVGEHIQISQTIGQDVNEPGPGAWFFIDHAGIGLRFNNNGLVVRRPWVERVGTYRTQPVPGAGEYMPAAHGYDYVFFNCDSVMRDIVLWNATYGIHITAHAATSQSRGDISGVYGCPMLAGIVVDFLADVIRIDNVHFWPYWTSNANAAAYQRNHAVGLSFYRCDNPMVTRYFTYGYRFSIFLASNTQGGTSKLKLQMFDFDFIGQSGVFVDGTSISCSLSDGSGQGHSATSANNFLEISSSASGCNVAMDNVDIGLFSQNVVRCGGAGNNVLRVGDNVRLYQWNGSGAGFPAIGCTAGNYVELSALPYFTGPLHAGPALDTDGSIKGRLELPVRTYSTDADGRVALPVNMGRAPAVIAATVVNDATAYHVQQTGTANVVRVSDVTSGAPLVNSAINIAAVVGFA